MDVLEREEANQQASAVVNDFALVAATANGTGSQTANLTLLRSFKRMGIPVHGKNIFPSNIQGLPTWYHIRVSHEGFIARKHPSILVAFNPATVYEDVNDLPAGGVCIYNDAIKGLPKRDDIHFYALPVKELIKDVDVPVQRKPYVANMTYVGALAFLLNIPLAKVEEALLAQFGGRQKLVNSNMPVVTSTFEWCQENLSKTDAFSVEPLNKTEGQIMMTGNEAGALGAIFGGASVAAWYPITPSTSFIDAFKEYLPQLRQSEEGKATYTVIQAEDELAAIGMTLGAGWAGARSVTATSGPGISLMSEFAGLGYFAEIPAVIWNIQRVGPSTGMPTRTGQGDITFTYYLGHGDTKNVILLPSSIEECFDFGVMSHDLADTLQTPIFVLSDLDLGMNNWMGKPFNYPTEPIKRGKVMSAEDIEAQGSFSRYLDKDGDGIGYRTLPGTDHPQAAYFTRGTGHNEHAVYSERSEDWLENSDRLVRKFNTARTLVPKAVLETQANAKIGIIAFGTTRYAIEEARTHLEDSLPTDFLRICALPINDDVKAFVESHERCYVIELNRDGQMHAILQTEMPELATKLKSIAYLDGMPLTSDWLESRLKQEENA